MSISERQQNKRDRLSKTSHIILSTLALTGSATVLFLMPGIAAGLKTILRIKRELDNSRLEEEMQHLAKKGYINRYRHESGDTYEISERGKFILSLNKKYHPEKSKTGAGPNSWDNVWRIVIFDIKEEMRAERDLLRRALHSYGFAYLQQSVWVYPYPCDDFITAAKAYLNLEKNVVYIKAQYIEGDQKMRQHFHIAKSTI